MALSMAAAIASDACAVASSSLALCWANVWIWASSLPLGSVLGASVTGGGDPSRRFFDGGGEPADEVSGEGRASVAARRGFGAAGIDRDAAARMENEFWVATL